jgi:predicted porin
MKKTLIALAAVAATGAAFAQSTVTLYGQADAALSSVKSTTNKLTGLLGAGRGSNFVGFMGTEDLGGGLKANFKLEAGYNLDNGTGAATNTNNQANGGAVVVTGATAAAVIAGTPNARPSLGGAQGLTFNRWSYAGLSGGFGEVRVGREYTPTFQAVLSADFLGANGVQNTLFQTLYIGQANSHATATSASNGISWESPRVSGLQAKAQMFYGETTPGLTSANIQTGKSGDGTSFRLDYTQGPVNAGYAAQETKGTSKEGNSVTGVGAVPGKYSVDTMYAKYDAGVAIIAVAQVTEKMVTAGTTSSTAAAVAGDLKNVSNVIGLRVPMGATTLNASYTTSKYTVNGAMSSTAGGGKGTQLGLQAIHALSKRTDVYVNYAVTDNTTDGTGKVYGIGNGSGRVVNVSNAGDKSTGFQIGMRHNF